MNGTVLEVPAVPAPSDAAPLRLNRTVPPVVLLLLITLFSGAATLLAMRRTSPTFDEIVLVAGGARGYHTGVFDLAPDHPPLTQYFYGLPVFLSGPTYPDETAIDSVTQSAGGYRYFYAQQFYYGVGNDPELISFLGRLPAALFAVLLVLMTFVVVRSRFGTNAALLAAAMVAFLPDVLAHGGVAYNDLPLTIGYLVALFALDGAIRRPTLLRGLGAGLLTGIALGTKISAIALAPAAVLFLVMEAVARRRDREWRVAIAPAAIAALAGVYLALVAVFLGDFALSEFRYGLEFRFRHFTGGHGTNAYLLGRQSPTGWWYFFPVAFLFKTSAALHLLMLIAAVAFVQDLVRDRAGALASHLRVPIIGVLVFGAVLLRSNLNIGFRYAMPLLPLFCVVTAVGIVRFWPRATRALRVVIGVAGIWLVAQPLSYYPHFLAYISEYGPGRDRNYEVLIDSSLDWGQGLLELRDFMRANDIPRVYLGYFGSGVPSAYGIEYVPFQSFFTLATPPATNDAEPEWIVISASLLQGSYTVGDPFHELREVEPDAVIGHTMLAWRVRR